mgnify:FL=1
MFLLSELTRFLLDKNLIDAMPVIDKEVEIDRFASLSHPSPDALCWSKKILPIEQIPVAAVLVCLPQQPHNSDLSTVMLHVKEPRRAFGEIVSHFCPEEHKTGISEKAVIHPTVIIGKDVYVGPGTVIGEHCRIGDGTVIDANVTIYRRVTIGKSCHIFSGAVIGADGHGYVLDGNKKYQKVRHMGNVVIGDNVDVGANSCVDRGVLDDTRIGDNTKIDNLVQVAHNVVIGENCMITGGCQIGGSCVIGNNSWLAPSCIVKNGTKVANEVRICMNSVVIRNVKTSNVTVYGDPAKVIFPYVIDGESQL